MTCKNMANPINIYGSNNKVTLLKTHFCGHEKYDKLKDVTYNNG